MQSIKILTRIPHPPLRGTFPPGEGYLNKRKALRPFSLRDE